MYLSIVTANTACSQQWNKKHNNVTKKYRVGSLSQPWINCNVIHGRNVKQGSKSAILRFKTNISDGVLSCLFCPNKIVTMMTAFKMVPKTICSDIWLLPRRNLPLEKWTICLCGSFPSRLRNYLSHHYFAYIHVLTCTYIHVLYFISSCNASCSQSVLE